MSETGENAEAARSVGGRERVAVHTASPTVVCLLVESCKDR